MTFKEDADKELLKELGKKIEICNVEKISISLLIRRLKSTTPAFFKKLQNFALGFGGLFGAVALGMQQGTIPAPYHLLPVFQFLAAFALGIVGTAQVTTTDPCLKTEDAK